MILKNTTAFPLQPTIEHVVTDSDYVPLSVVISAIDTEENEIFPVAVPMADGSWTLTLPPLDAGASIRVPLQAIAGKIEQAEVRSILCIKTDLGTEQWIPVTGLREDLK